MAMKIACSAKHPENKLRMGFHASRLVCLANLLQQPTHLRSIFISGERLLRFEASAHSIIQLMTTPSYAVASHHNRNVNFNTEDMLLRLSTYYKEHCLNTLTRLNLV